MANATTEKKSSNKIIVILLIIIILLLIGGGITAFVFLNADRPDDEPYSLPTMKNGQIPMDITAGVLDIKGIKKWNEDALKQAELDRIPIQYAPAANSVDGKNFACVIGNPEGSPRCFYVDLYADTSFEEEVYLSGLIPPGRGLTSFTTTREFPQGETDAVLVVTTVDDDMKTIVAQTMVYLTLNVGEQQQ